MFLFVLAGLYGFLYHSLHLVTDKIPDNYMAKVAQWASVHYSLTELIILPVFSLATWLAFRKWNYNYFEHVVMNAFIAGQRLLLSLLLLPVLYCYGEHPLMDKFRTVSMCITLVVNYIDYSQFFKGHSFIYLSLRIVLVYLYVFIIILLVAIPIGLAIAYAEVH